MWGDDGCCCCCYCYNYYFRRRRRRSWSIGRYSISFVALSFTSIQRYENLLDESQKISRQNVEDAGNFGFGHLSKPFVTFRLFHFSSIFDCSRRTTKNDKEASRPLSEPPFFFRSAGWPDPSPILRIDTDRRFNHDAMAEFPCSRETSQHMLFWNIIADPCSTCMRYYRSILLFWKFSRNRLDNTTWSTFTWSDYTSFSKCPRVIGTTRTHFHVGSS